MHHSWWFYFVMSIGFLMLAESCAEDSEKYDGIRSVWNTVWLIISSIIALVLLVQGMTIILG